MKKLLPLFVVLALLVGVILFFRGNGPRDSPATVWEQGTEIRTDAVSFSTSSCKTKPASTKNT
ncbi:MAG: hypothetical protein IPM82_16730 [Saprospiraceae bacterium]|nr:hypothetical protein [Saprospiraceae bacterium]